MTYQVIARKWRPQSFDDMVGQETVTRTLRNALTSGRIAHAFLFSGVRGVGKTTTARILAKALNCTEGVSDEPCNACVSCTEIREGNSVDVQEIDAASNRGIDNIRELRESARYGTARDRFKIFIVDEVHMLTNEAFNALLKTLEEPPEHVKFILATTEFHKIPTTITSRCQKYEFKPIPFSGIRERLRLITESEDVSISDYALGVVASVARGSMRDAQSALDQLIAFSGDEIRDADVTALLGIVDQGVVSTLIDRVQERDRHGLIQDLHDLVASGISAQMVCSKLIERVRNLLVCKAAGWSESLLQLPDSEKEGLMKQADVFSELDLIRLYDLLNKTAGELRWHSEPNVHLEITLLKLVEVTQLARIEEVLDELKGRAGGSLPPGNDSGPANTQKSPRDSSSPPSGAATGRASGRSGNRATRQKGEEAPEPSRRGEKSSSEESGEEREEEDRESSSSGARPDESVNRLMNDLQERFKGLYQQLRFASRIAYREGKLEIRFPSSERFHASMVEGSDNRDRLSQTFASIVGETPEIDIAIDESREENEPKRKKNPTEDPKLKSFIDRFPGKVIVKREYDD